MKLLSTRIERYSASRGRRNCIGSIPSQELDPSAVKAEGTAAVDEATDIILNHLLSKETAMKGTENIRTAVIVKIIWFCGIPAK
jgi:hypothetical protein